MRAWVAVAGVLAACGAGEAGEAVDFHEGTLIVEINATDGDAGLQLFLDHDPWRSVSVTTPAGDVILNIEASAALEGYGLTELFSESSEPPFSEFALEQFVELLPPGDYRFSGETIEGARIERVVPLTHAFPSGPEITAPAKDSTVVGGGVVVRWRAAEQVADVEVVAYQVVVTQEEPRLRMLRADLPLTAAELAIPAAFTAVSGEYQAEVLAIDVSGNQTLMEVAFEVE